MVPMSRNGGRHGARLAAAIVAVLMVLSTPLEAGVTKRVVFKSGTEGYNIYRIPTIIKAANGDLLAFAEARSGGDASEIDIVMKRSTDDGETWGPLRVVVENDHYRSLLPAGREVTVGNQSPVVDEADPEHPGRIWMPFTLENDRVFVTYSDDHGETWHANANGLAREITADVKKEGWGWYATGPVHGIQLTRGEYAGRLIIPSDHREANQWGSHVVYSDDHGATWKIGGVDTRPGSDAVRPNENVAVELVDGRVYFNTRDQGGTGPGNRAVTYSSDGGTTYDSPFVSAPVFTTPVVQNSALRFYATDEGDGKNLLIHAGPGQSGSRSDMTLWFSTDETETWQKVALVHPGPSAYSDLVKIDSERFGLLWEAGNSLYDEILFGAFNIADFDNLVFNGIHGDVNQDGVVDAADLQAFVAVWNPMSTQHYLGGRDSYINGDLNFDGVQDINDAILLRKHLRDAGVPWTQGALSYEVAEPTSATWCALGVFGAVVRNLMSRLRLLE
jgi:sialidase-1